MPVRFRPRFRINRLLSTVINAAPKRSDISQHLRKLIDTPTGSNITSFRQLIQDSPYKYTLISNIDETLVPFLINTIDAPLFLANSYYHIRDHGFTNCHSLGAISDHLTKLAGDAFNPNDREDMAKLDMTDPIDLTLIIFRLCVYYRYTFLASRIVYDACRTVLAEPDYDEMHRFAKLVNPLVVDNFVRLVSIRDPRKDRSELIELFQVVNIYNSVVGKASKDGASWPQAFRFSQVEIITILNKVSSLNEDVKVTELVMREIGHSMSVLASSLPIYGGSADETTTKSLNLTQILHHYLFFCYRYIEDRIRNNDAGAVYSAWTILAPFHNKLLNSVVDSPNNNRLNDYYYYAVLSRMITMFSKNIRYRELVNGLIASLPIDAVKICPSLMTTLLYHCARTHNRKLSDILLLQYDENTLGLPTKYTTGQMYALLWMALSCKNFQRAREIIKYMKDQLIDFSPVEFNQLVCATLRSDMPDAEESSWQMITGKAGYEAQYAYITYLNYMIDHDSMDFAKIEYMFGNATKSVDKKYRRFWNYWDVTYFKYIGRKFGCQTAIEVYENCTAGNAFKTLADFQYNIDPFTSRLSKVRMPLDVKVRPLIVRDIFQLAYKQRTDYPRRKLWCQLQMKKLGISDRSIIADFSKTIAKRSRKAVFENRPDTNDDNDDEQGLEDAYLGRVRLIDPSATQTFQ